MIMQHDYKGWGLTTPEEELPPGTGCLLRLFTPNTQNGQLQQTVGELMAKASDKPPLASRSGEAAVSGHRTS
jgi:hypothetical protein